MRASSENRSLSNSAGWAAWRCGAAIAWTLVAAGSIAAEFRFTSANFITSSPSKVAWLDESTVIFSIGGGVTILGTDCYPNPKSECNNNRSIQTWIPKSDSLSIYEPDASLACLSRGRITYVKGNQFYSGMVGQSAQALGVEPSNLLNWDDCVPSIAETWTDDKGFRRASPRRFRQFYDFANAYFEATRYGFPKTRVTWTALDGSKQIVDLVKGPWNDRERLHESYYPTKSGVIVVERRDNYLADENSHRRFFPGFISSSVGVSPSGCQVSFFGNQMESSKSVVRLYVARMCD